MRYLARTPPPSLAPFIEKLYILEHNTCLTAPAELGSPANPCSAMVLNYGDRYRLHSDFSDGTLLPASFLTGFSSRAYRLELTGRVSMLGVIFRGVGMRAFFSSVNLSELTNQRHDLSAIVGTDADRLCDQLANAPTNDARFALVEAWLIRRMSRVNRTPTVADAAARLMLDRRGMLTMDALADRVCVSPRHLRRIFHDQAGISPKFYARLKRFNYVHFTLTRNPLADWPDFLTNGGFYDQSHLIKDFVEFTGKAPSVALSRYRQLIESVTE
jgi:AraC-like DNA-binding protein